MLTKEKEYSNMTTEIPYTLHVNMYTFTKIELSDIPEEVEILVRTLRPTTRVTFVALERDEQIYVVHVDEEDKSDCYLSMWKYDLGEWCAVYFNEHHMLMWARLSSFAHSHLKG